MAFVIIQHLDPKHTSMLPELIGRVTAMPVMEAEDNSPVLPNHVYVIPPGKSMAILRGRLHLVPVEKVRGQHMPIDYFFTSLAEDQGGNSIGVVLSGSASDGARGVRVIKAEGGIVIAQDEKSSKYFSMPSSAIETGCVDLVLPPESIAAELNKISRHPLAAAGKTIEAMSDAALLDKIFIRLRDFSGVDFSQYKKTTILRRIKRRMVLHKIERIEHYLRYLLENPSESKALYQDILISVTSFFRDPESFQALKEKVFSAVLKNRRADDPIRVWVPGCATGEEAYSIAMCLTETLGDRPAAVQIFATDIDERALEKARAGVYEENIAAEVSPERLRRFFLKVEGGYHINKSIRDLCVFARQNVFKDPPFSRLDLISCRNLLIYVEQELQKKILSIFHYGLKPDGFLMLGTSESIGGSADLFAVVDRKFKIYSRKTVRVRPEIDFSKRPAIGEPPPAEKKQGKETWVGQDLKYAVDRIIVERYGLAGVVVNEDLQVLQFHGRTGPYIEHKPGMADLNLLKLAKEGLLFDLRAAVEKSKKEGKLVRKEGVRVRQDDMTKEVDIEVVPLKQISTRERYFLVLFQESRPAKRGKSAKAVRAHRPHREEDELTEVKRELTATREYLQTVIDERETTNEELKSANEEILSSNEELQSTNEELETAKEELQSTNEELSTVNEELENRNNELVQVNNDLLNLFSSANLPIVMLDMSMNMRRFTPATEKVLNLIPSDAGRPIGHIKPKVEVPDLEQLIRNVIRTGLPERKEVMGSEGRWYSMQITAYKTVEERVEGAILLFVDITEIKTSHEAELDSLSLTRMLLDKISVIVHDSNDAIFAQDLDGRILSWNIGAERIYGYSESEAVGKDAAALISEPERKENDAMMKRLLDGAEVRSFRTRHRSKDGKLIEVSLTATVLRDEHGNVVSFIFTIRELPAAP